MRKNRCKEYKSWLLLFLVAGLLQGGVYLSAEDVTVGTLVKARGVTVVLGTVQGPEEAPSPSPRAEPGMGHQGCRERIKSRPRRAPRHSAP